MSNTNICNTNAFAIPGLMGVSHRKEAFTALAVKGGCNCVVKIPFACQETAVEVTASNLRYRNQGSENYVDLELPYVSGVDTLTEIVSVVVGTETEYYLSLDPCLLEWCDGLHFVYLCVDIAGETTDFKCAVSVSTDHSRVTAKIDSPGE